MIIRRHDYMKIELILTEKARMSHPSKTFLVELSKKALEIKEKSTIEKKMKIEVILTEKAREEILISSQTKEAKLCPECGKETYFLFSLNKYYCFDCKKYT
jgi:hypothetical protein